LPGQEEGERELDSLETPLNESSAVTFRFGMGEGGKGGGRGGGGGDAVVEFDEEGGGDVRDFVVRGIKHHLP